MSVSENESGIVDQHVAAIEQTALAKNTFIFIRPTEFDSTILIRAGYATKSMDVHHKSSNWGPMAGFVPCDPAFSKKCEGSPNPDEHEHKHGAAHPVQLSLKPEVLAGHEKIEFESGYVLTHSGESQPLDVPWIVKKQSSKERISAARDKFEAFQAAGGGIPEHKFCKANPEELGNKSTRFCLIKKAGEWLVYWFKMEKEGVARLHPLRVFAYAQDGKLNPVTGDYDLWMVAPHFSRLDEHQIVRIEADIHGKSAASGFTMALIQLMNKSCGRSDNPVFNHGAEAQNYGFTQALDWNLAMFTPSGASRMVRMNQMPQILSDLQRAGYLVVWNKRYGESDPQLMGRADDRGAARVGQIRSELDALFLRLGDFRKDMAPEIARQALASKTNDMPRMPATMKQEINLMAQRFETSRQLGREQSRIYRFHRQLLEFLGTQVSRFRVLTKDDFPMDFRSYGEAMLRLHNELQQTMVAATTGSGESADRQLTDWLNSHGREIESLKAYWR